MPDHNLNIKVLVVSPQPFFSPRGTPFSVYYRTLITSELGAKIDLLTYGEGEDVSITNVNIIRIPRFRCFGNVKIGPSLLKLFLDFFITLKMIWLLITRRYDVVHAHEESIFIGLILRPIFRFKMIYDMRSSLPQQLTNFQFTTSSFLIKLFESLENACLKRSDAVITICPDLYKYVNNIITDREKHFLIENSIFEPVKLATNMHVKDKSDFTKESLGINSRLGKLVIYAGTLEKYQGIDILIPAFADVLEKGISAQLIIVGGSNEQVNEFRNLVINCNAQKNISLVGRVPQSIAKIYNSFADVLLSPRSDGTNTPLKVYEQLASGKPLVATDIYSHTQVLNNDVCFLVKPNQSDMASGIIEALDNKKEVDRKISNALKMYEELYSRPIYKEKLRQIYGLAS